MYINTKRALFKSILVTAQGQGQTVPVTGIRKSAQEFGRHLITLAKL
jgi:hypothetical protein